MEGFTSALVPLIAGLLLVTTGVCASCPLELSASRVVVKLGDSVSINCSTSEKDIEGMGWEATRGGIPLGHRNHSTWTVENLDRWDASPSCFLNPPKTPGNSTFEQCTVSPDIVLYTFPESINIKSDASGVMTLQEERTLTCEIERVEPVQNLSIRWFRNDQPFDNATLTSTDKKPRTVVSVIQLKASREENEVAYRCEAHLDLRPEGPYLETRHEYNVTVHYGPEINCSSSSLMVNEGTTLEKVCRVTGNPIPTVKWLKGGQRINPTTPLTRDKAGPYTLTAEGYTSVEKNFMIYVSYGPELMCESNQTVMEHDPFTLNCTLEGYPKPELAFCKDGAEVFLPERLGREHEGSYVISASIGRQTVESRINISVSYPPSPITELEDSEVDVGHNVSLKCTSKGNPRPKYFWDYYRTTNVIEKYEDEVSYLIISNATVDNMDFYTCSVRNGIGNVSKTVKLTVKGVEPECPIEISPNRMVVPYGSRGQQANCSTKFKHRPRDLVGHLYWKDQQSSITNGSYWSVDMYDNWNIKADCVAKFKGIPECKKQLDITVYKTPDSVFINHLNYSSSVVEDKEFQLQCNITNVAPVSKLDVRWYQGNKTFKPRNKGTMQVTGCQNDTDCDLSLVRTPVNVLVTISVTLKREHSGATFWCEAHLDLGPEGPQPSPTNMSGPLNLTVYYKPTINATKLPKTIPVFNGYPEELICEADGNPPPLILWFQSSDEEPRVDKPTLMVYKAGLYRCNAINIVASVSHEVEVILKEDYLPLIAGFVAVAVIIISVVFVFIYSIYYKNTKMRRYSLKNPKLSTHNGNVAHNGWEFQFPMKRLS